MDSGFGFSRPSSFWLPNQKGTCQHTVTSTPWHIPTNSSMPRRCSEPFTLPGCRRRAFTPIICPLILHPGEFGAHENRAAWNLRELSAGRKMESDCCGISGNGWDIDGAQVSHPACPTQPQGSSLTHPRTLNKPPGTTMMLRSPHSHFTPLYPQWSWVRIRLQAGV